MPLADPRRVHFRFIDADLLHGPVESTRQLTFQFRASIHPQDGKRFTVEDVLWQRTGDAFAARQGERSQLLEGAQGLRKVPGQRSAATHVNVSDQATVPD